MENHGQIIQYCDMIFKHAGLYIKGRVRLHYADCLIQATGLEMKRTGFEQSVLIMKVIH